MVNEPIKIVDKFIKANDKFTKRNLIYAYAERRAISLLGSHAQHIIHSPAFFNERWLKKSYRDTQWQNDIDSTIEKALTDLNIISSYDDNIARILEARYYDTLSLAGMDKFLEHASIPANSQSLPKDSSKPVVEPKSRSNSEEQLLYGVFKLYGTRVQLNSIVRQMQIMDINFEILDKGQLNRYPE